MRGTTGVAAVGAVLAFVSGAEIVAHGPLVDLDRSVALGFWPIQETSATKLGKFLADIGKPVWACVAIGALALALTWRRRQCGPCLAAGAGLGIVGLSTLLLKNAFPHQGIWGSSGSFPSGHTGVAVVAAGLLAYLLLPPRAWREAAVVGIAAVWGLIMAWGRLVIETHWLSDVIAGWGIGICALIAAVRLADSPLGRRGSAPPTQGGR